MKEVQILDPYARPIPPQEQRASYANPEEWMWEAFGGSKSVAGERVNMKAAMTVAAFFACIRNISEDIAKLPKKIRQDQKRGSVNVPDHPVQFLLDEPNEETDCHTFWQTLVAHACARHGGFAEIQRNGAGQPVGLYLMDPSIVSVLRNSAGALVYRVNYGGEFVYMAQKDVLHLHGLGGDGACGYDIVGQFKDLLGTAIALQKFRAAFFGNGATPIGALTHPKTLSKEVLQHLRDDMEKRYTGGANAHRVMILEEGMTFSPVSVDPERAQMDQMTNLTVADICRIFRMPPHKVQDLIRSTFSNIEHQAIEYVTDALDPWCDKLRRELERKLLTRIERRQGLKVHINIKGIMRGDMATRAAFYKDLFNMGAMTPNQICELEDMPGYEGGDRYYIMLNLTPADRVDEIIDKQTAKDAPKPAALPAPEPKPDPAQDRVRESYEMLLANRIENILRIEADKAKRAKDTPEFWEKHQKHVADQMREQIAAVALGIGRDVNTEILACDYAEAHNRGSREDIAGGDLRHWQSGERAKVAAKALLYKIEQSPERKDECKSIAA